jgi:hypothetical protein
MFSVAVLVWLFSMAVLVWMFVMDVWYGCLVCGSMAV